MSNLPTLKYRAFDTNGDPVSGAKLYTYTVGTTTPKTTYSEHTLTTPHANPIVADANGWFGEIYLTVGASYRFILKTSADVTIFDVDNVAAATVDSADLIEHLYELATHPGRYGAAGDGSTDDSTDLQEAIDAATATRDGVVDLAGRTYKCNSTINLKSGLTLRNGGIDFSACASDDYLSAVGSLGGAVALTGSTTFGAATVSCTTTGLVAGDLVCLYEDTTIEAEILRLYSVAVGSFVPTTEVLSVYSTPSAAIKKITPLTDICLDNLTITASSGASGAGRVILFDKCSGVTVRNVRVNGIKGAGIEVRGSIDVRIEDCRFGNVGTRLGVGVDVSDSSRDVVVRGCTSRSMATGFRAGNQPANGLGGITRFVKFSDCLAESCTVGFYAMSTSQYVAFRDVTNDGGGATQYGIRLAGYDGSIDGATTRGVASTSNYAGVYVDGSSAVASIGGSGTLRGTRVRNVTASDGNKPILATISGALDYGGLEISGCILPSSDSSFGIYVTVSNNNLNYLRVIGNTLFACGIDITATVAVDRGVVAANIIESGNITIDTIKRVAVYGNVVEGDDANPAVSVADATYSLIAANVADADMSSDNVVEIDGSVGIGVTANVVRNEGIGAGVVFNNGGDLMLAAANVITGGTSSPTMTYGVQVDQSTTTCSIVGNAIDGIGANAGANAGIKHDATSAGQNTAIVGNSIESNDRAIILEGAQDNFAITGNAVEASTTVNSAVYIDGDSAASIQFGAITGNAIGEAVYGIETNNVGTNILHDGNAFKDPTTAITTGTITAGDSET